MHSIAMRSQEHPVSAFASGGAIDGTVETRVWVDEHDWLLALWKSSPNTGPRFRCPDLIGACVVMVLGPPDGLARLFHYLSTELALRQRQPARREVVWAGEHRMLLAAQLSPANRHPHPMFQLDQLTTGCVALARAHGDEGEQVLWQARLNMAERAARWTPRQVHPSQAA